MICLLDIDVKVLCPWIPLMKISLRLLKLIGLFICVVQYEVIVSALHISALERRYLNSNYCINRFLKMIFRNE